MKIAIPSLGPGRHRLQTAAPVGDYKGLAEKTGLRFTGIVGVDLVANKMNEDLYVQATVTGTIETECGRCLAPIKQPVRTMFQALYLPERERDVTGPQTHKAEVESQRVLYYGGGVVDLDEQIIEALGMAAPMKPLCGADCKGMCPTCGKNLNEGACGCKGKDTFGQPFKGLFGKK